MNKDKWILQGISVLKLFGGLKPFESQIMAFGANTNQQRMSVPCQQIISEHNIIGQQPTLCSNIYKKKSTSLKISFVFYLPIKENLKTI